MAYITNQPPKTQCKTNNSYCGHHLKTGNNTESLINKPHLVFPSPTTKKQLQEEIADKFEGEMAESLINKPHQADSNQELKEDIADKFEEKMADKFKKANKFEEAEEEMDDRYEEADKLKEANKFEEKMANTTNQPPRTSARQTTPTTGTISGQVITLRASSTSPTWPSPPSTSSQVTLSRCGTTSPTGTP